MRSSVRGSAECGSCRGKNDAGWVKTACSRSSFVAHAKSGASGLRGYPRPRCPGPRRPARRLRSLRRSPGAGERPRVVAGRCPSPPGLRRRRRPAPGSGRAGGARGRGSTRFGTPLGERAKSATAGPGGTGQKGGRADTGSPAGSVTPPAARPPAPRRRAPVFWRAETAAAAPRGTGSETALAAATAGPAGLPRRPPGGGEQGGWLNGAQSGGGGGRTHDFLCVFAKRKTHNPRCVLTLSLPLFTAETEAGAAPESDVTGEGPFRHGWGVPRAGPVVVVVVVPRGCRRVLDFRGGGELML